MLVVSTRTRKGHTVHFHMLQLLPWDLWYIPQQGTLSLSDNLGLCPLAISRKKLSELSNTVVSSSP